MSARVTGVEVVQPARARARDGGAPRRLVLREYGAANLRADPQAGMTEYRLLQLLHGAGLPVPRPFYAEAQCLLVEFIDGERVDDPPDLAAFIDPLAATLAALHETGFGPADVPFLATVRDDWAVQMGTRAQVPDEALSETAIRRALGGRWPPAEVNQPVIVHGDYWPGNALWRECRLAGIVDWEDALFGDPLADLGVARLEIRWFFGAAAMSRFTDRYLALRPTLDVTAMPVWDLRAALRPAGKLAAWGLTPDEEARMTAAHRQFVAEALGQLDGAPVTSRSRPLHRTMPPRARTPMMAFVSASSPSESRLELGSSSNTRNGSR